MDPDHVGRVGIVFPYKTHELRALADRLGHPSYQSDPIKKGAIQATRWLKVRLKAEWVIEVWKPVSIARATGVTQNAQFSLSSLP
jgi:hypothetical protein